ncbi:hypothetical protein B0T25DRAFT_521424 [Lasiosphaeria hispida]|uniref:Ankyrin n=1 Tax=Lasiosphaeria hispida TaxID=260671 RepID=A0AAJ0HDC0_9PEZI|nr:hypothetical protein B0T25DRAFT_521424 [Lasiosphaeria hispida]
MSRPAIFRVPLEVWETIIDELLTCKDILNFSMAYCSDSVAHGPRDIVLAIGRTDVVAMSNSGAVAIRKPDNSDVVVDVEAPRGFSAGGPFMVTLQERMLRPDVPTTVTRRNDNSIPALYWAIGANRPAFVQRVAGYYTSVGAMSLLMGHDPFLGVDHLLQNRKLINWDNHQVRGRWTNIDMGDATPLMLAVASGRIEILEALLEGIKNLAEPWHSHVLNMARKPVNLSVEQPSPLESKGSLTLSDFVEDDVFFDTFHEEYEKLRIDISHYTAIEMAAYLGRVDMMRALYEAGARLRVKSGLTTWNLLFKFYMEQSAWTNRLEALPVVDYLLEKGFDLNEVCLIHPDAAPGITENHGRTVLELMITHLYSDEANPKVRIFPAQMILHLLCEFVSRARPTDLKDGPGADRMRGLLWGADFLQIRGPLRARLLSLCQFADLEELQLLQTLPDKEE